MSSRLARRSQAGAVGLVLGSAIFALLFWPSSLQPKNPLVHHEAVAEVADAPARQEVSTAQTFAAAKPNNQPDQPAPKNDPPLPALKPSPPVSQGVLNRIKSFDDLKREATTYLNSRDGEVAVAVYQPGKAFPFVLNGDQPLPLASVAKVEIMVAFLDMVRKANRAPTIEERTLLHAMITESDNAAADALWHSLGGARPLKNYMNSIGLQALVPSEEWGANQDTAREMAALLARLGQGDILDEPTRQIASELLFRTSPEQRWGVSAGLSQNQVLMKDGWFPGEEGWRVNSAGIVAGPDGRMSYVLVVLSDSQPSFQYGVDTVSAVSQMTNTLMQRAPR